MKNPKERNSKATEKANTLIVKVDSKSAYSKDNSSVTYTREEIDKLMKKHFPQRLKQN